MSMGSGLAPRQNCGQNLAVNWLMENQLIMFSSVVLPTLPDKSHC